MTLQETIKPLFLEERCKHNQKRRAIKRHWKEKRFNLYVLIEQ